MLKLPSRYHEMGKPLLKLTKERKQLLQNFFDFQQKNYKKKEVPCPCNITSDDILVSRVDRTGFPFPVVLCKNCGLIRAKEYWTPEDTLKYYQDWYRKCYSEDAKENPSDLYNDQLSDSQLVFNLVSANADMKKVTTVLDIGGGTGGYLKSFQNSNMACDLYDYNIRYLEFAKSQGINTFVGGISEVSSSGKKYDLIILSHVVEHFLDINSEINNLRKVMHDNTIVYVAVPGLDSLKQGRRDYDLLGDIQDAHVYYFSSYTLTNLFERLGFESIYKDSITHSLFKFIRKPQALKNYFYNSITDIYLAEAIRISKYPKFKKMLRKVIKG